MGSVRYRGLLLLAAAALVMGVATLAAAPGLAQPLVEDWTRTVPNHVGTMMDLDAADNVFALGYRAGIVTRKYDPNGALQWERSNPTPEVRALPTWISTDQAGSAFISAYRISGVSSPTGWIVIKYDSRGNLLWKDLVRVSRGRTVRVETDRAGNAYVTGTMLQGNSAGNATVDAVTIKYAPDGTRLWRRAFNANPYADDQPFSIAVSADGSRVAVVGQSNGAFFTVVYDAQGRRLGHIVQPALYEGRDAAFGPGNELYVGTARWTPETSNRMTVLKFTADGDLVWMRSYAPGDFVYRLAVDFQGNVVAAGVDQGPNAFLDWVTLKITAAGAALWSRKYDAHQKNDERPFSIDLDPAGGVYVTGEAGPAPPGPNLSDLRMTTVKYASNGSREWVLFTDGGRGVSVRIGTDRGAYLQGLGAMLTARYHETAPG